jgi:hypothetical protein
MFSACRRYLGALCGELKAAGKGHFWLKSLTWRQPGLKCHGARGGVAQLVRASACHAEGRGFESRRSRQISRIIGISGTAHFRGQIPGGQAMTSKPVGIPPGVRPSTGVHAAGMRWQPSTVHAIWPCRGAGCALCTTLGCRTRWAAVARSIAKLGSAARQAMTAASFQAIAIKRAASRKVQLRAARKGRHPR